MDPSRWTEIKRWGTAVTWVYFTFLFAWVLLYWATHDRFAYLALINTLAVYLFIPMPLVGVWAFMVRRREVWGRFGCRDRCVSCPVGQPVFANLAERGG